MATVLTTEWTTVKSWLMSDNHVVLGFQVKYSVIDASTIRIHARANSYFSIKASTKYDFYASVTGKTQQSTIGGRWTNSSTNNWNPSPSTDNPNNDPKLEKFYWDVPANWTGSVSMRTEWNGSYQDKCYEGTSEDPSYYDFVNDSWSDAVTFPVSTLSLSVSPSGGGIVAGAGTYATGGQVSATAGANPGYRFVGWYNGQTQVSTNSLYTFTLSSNTSLTAKFVKTYTYARSAGTGGSIGSGSTANGTYDDGASITAIAVANTGYRFNKWTGTKTSPSSTFTFTLDQNVSITAEFIKTYNINILSNNSKYGSVSPTGGTYDVGTELSLVATPSSCGIFLGWYKGDTLLYRSSRYTYTVNDTDGDTTLTARFCSVNINRFKIAE